MATPQLWCACGAMVYADGTFSPQDNNGVCNRNGGTGHVYQPFAPKQVVRRNDPLTNLQDKVNNLDDIIDIIKRELMNVYRLDASQRYSTYTQTFDIIAVAAFAGIIALIIRAGVVAPEDGRCFIVLGLSILNVILLYLIKKIIDHPDIPFYHRIRGSLLSLGIGLATFFEIGKIKDGFVITILCYIVAGLLPIIDIYFKFKTINQLRKAHRIVMDQFNAKIQKIKENEKSVKKLKKASNESSGHSLVAPSHGSSSSESKLSRNKSDPSLVSANNNNVVTIPLSPVNE